MGGSGLVKPVSPTPIAPLKPPVSVTPLPKPMPVLPPTGPGPVPGFKAEPLGARGIIKPSDTLVGKGPVTLTPAPVTSAGTLSASGSSGDMRTLIAPDSGRLLRR